MYVQDVTVEVTLVMEDHVTIIETACCLGRGAFSGCDVRRLRVVLLTVMWLDGVEVGALSWGSLGGICG